MRRHIILELLLGGIPVVSVRVHRASLFLCPQARGEKYETAIKWGVHVVTADWLLRCARHGYQAGSESLYHPGRVVEDNAPLVTVVAKRASEETTAEATLIRSAAEPLSLSDNTSARCTTPSNDGESGETASGAVRKEIQQTVRPKAEAGEGHRTENSAPRAPDTASPKKMSKPATALMQPTGGAEQEKAEPLKTIPNDIPMEDLSIGEGRGVSAAASSDMMAATARADHAPVTSELERQLRSMLSSAEGGGAGATAAASSVDGPEAPALHRRLRLNARGVRPAPFSSNIIPNAAREQAGEGGVSSRSTSTTTRANESDLSLHSSRTSSEGQGSRKEGLSLAPVSSVASPARHSGSNTVHGKTGEVEELPMVSIVNGTCKRKTGQLDGGGRKRHADFRKTFVARSRQRVGGGYRSFSALSSVVNERDGGRRMNWAPPPLVVARQKSVAKDHIRWEGQENDPLLCRGLVRLYRTIFFA